MPTVAIDRHGRVGGRLDGRDVASTLKELAARTGIASTLVSGYRCAPRRRPLGARCGDHHRAARSVGAGV